MLKFPATIFILTYTLSSCSLLSDTGTNTLIKESSNKRHDKKAILFLKEAAATVPDSYQVTVCDNDHTLDKGEVGNAFRVDTDHGKTWLDSSSINFTWLSSDTLQIDYDKKLRTFIQENKVQGVTLMYSAR
jgi:hypothetical protein